MPAQVTMLRVILAAALLAVPVAAADETHPDCEPTQPWAGYARTDPVREAYAAQGSPGGLAACEGEQWDGQDPITQQASSCSGFIVPDPGAPHGSFCLGPDPNARPGDDPLNPLGVRASSEGGRAYGAANVVLVSRVAVYADEGSVAVYYRDNTPGNIVWSFTQPVTPIGPAVSENDCTQDLYEWGAYHPPTPCWRDNTAITIEHGLLA